MNVLIFSPYLMIVLNSFNCRHSQIFAHPITKKQLTHQVWAGVIHISFLWEPDVNVEELREVAKEDAVQGGGRAAKDELLCAEQLGDGVEVFERHLPDFRFCVPSNPLQVRPEYVMLFH